MTSSSERYTYPIILLTFCAHTLVYEMDVVGVDVITFGPLHNVPPANPEVATLCLVVAEDLIKLPGN